MVGIKPNKRKERERENERERKTASGLHELEKIVRNKERR